MENPLLCFCLRFVLTLSILLPLHAQTTANAPPDNKPTAANPAPAGQAPDEVMKKLSDLVHAGKYTEAQQLIAGLLLAYPDDRRLIKAKALLDKSLATAGPKAVTPGGNSPMDNVVSTQPTASTKGEPLAGMDNVDYNALIELARQAQQTTDLEQQNASLRQFMTDSGLFLQKHPNEMLLWQLRVASAISLNDPMAAYEAGQKLIAAGAADSSDTNLQRLLAQLKNKGWLDKQRTEDQAEWWLMGTWSVSWSYSWRGNHGSANGSYRNEIFAKSGSVIEGYEINDAGEKSALASIRGTILNSGEIRWEHYYPTDGRPPFGEFPEDYQKEKEKAKSKNKIYSFFPSGWQPVVSCELDQHKATMTMVIASQLPDECCVGKTRNRPWMYPLTLSFTRIAGPQ